MSRSYHYIQECNKEICEKYKNKKNTTLYYFECSLQNTRQEK